MVVQDGRASTAAWARGLAGRGLEGVGLDACATTVETDGRELAARLCKPMGDPPSFRAHPMRTIPADGLPIDL
jgi:hypothetical protein